MRAVIFAIFAAALVAQPAALPAQTGAKAQQASPLQSVIGCTSIADPGERLACFDREVRLIGESERSGEIVVMDREQVGKTRRSLFGLALPSLNLFGGGSNSEEMKQMETTIAAAAQDGRGRWTLDLAEGGRWVQTDSSQLIIDPAPGHSIRIRRAALGSYLANINDQRAIRVRRAN